jgi:hypothetical protein
MTTFNRVDPRKLTLGKRYLVLEKIQNKSIYIFKGKIEKLIDNTFDTNDEIIFSTISSIFMKQHKKNYSVYSFDATFYEYIHTKPKIQKNMEDRSLIDIMRNIIGDETFTHPLFNKEEKLNMNDIELIETIPVHESYYTDSSEDEDEVEEAQVEYQPQEYNNYRIKITDLPADVSLDIINIE